MSKKKEVLFPPYLAIFLIFKKRALAGGLFYGEKKREKNTLFFSIFLKTRVKIISGKKGEDSKVEGGEWPKRWVRVPRNCFLKKMMSKFGEKRKSFESFRFSPGGKRG